MTTMTASALHTNDLTLCISDLTTTDDAWRACTVLLAGPNHLIGERRQVEEYHTPSKRGAAVTELPPWYAEWQEFLPHWQIEILETPQQVTAFFTAAQRDPATPRVGMITNSKLSLAQGYAPGVEDNLAPWALGHDRRLPETIVKAEQVELEARRKARRKARQAEIELAAAVDEDAETMTLLPGVSPRTQARDALLRGARSRWGLGCPRCGHRLLSSSYTPETAIKTARLATVTCEWCSDSLGQWSRERDNVGDRELGLWHTPAYQRHAYGVPTGVEVLTHDRPPNDADGAALRLGPDDDLILDASGTPRLILSATAPAYYSADGYPVVLPRVIPWGTRPTSNPRYPLGKLIGKRFAGLVDLFICDEIHESKSLGSAIGAAFGAMVNAAHRTVGLTGTLMGGYASDVYGLLLRLGHRPTIEEYGWDGEARFIEENGVVDTVTRELTSITEGHYSGKTTTTTTPVERPGVTPKLMSTLQGVSVTVLLKHMGFRLPGYSEQRVLLDLPADVQADYEQLAAEGRSIISFGGHDALGSYLQSCLLYPYAPWLPKTIGSTLKKQEYTPPAHADDRILPHHTWLAEYAATEVQNGRRVLVFCEHTNKHDLMVDVAQKIMRLAEEQHGTTLKVAILRATTVKPGERRAWFAAREADGTTVVLCNPRLVKTGLNLIGWPSIVVLEPLYSLYTLAQAKRRAFRPTQTADCAVTFVAYRDTMSATAITIIARKSGAAAIVNGDDLSNGLLEFDPSGSLLQELAKLVMAGDDRALDDDVEALLAAGAHALKAELEAGTADLLHIPVEVTTPEPVTASDCRLPETATVLAATSNEAAPDVSAADVTSTDVVRTPEQAGAEDALGTVQLSLFDDDAVVPAVTPRRLLRVARALVTATAPITAAA